MGKSEYRILLVDDEPDILEILSHHLGKEGYIIFTATNGKEGIEMALRCKPHLIIMDVMMPEIDGIEACEQIRANDKLNNPLITFLTARSEDYSQIAGFKAGADDYISKPVKLKVLSQRIKALLRRNVAKYSDEPSEEISKDKIKLGTIEIDREKHLVIVAGNEMTLPKKEFKLLLLLSSKPGTVFTREDIFSRIWGDDVVVGERTIDVHIRSLREKIGNHRIGTIKGVGYKFLE
jgi:two-component system alkaline phosphatase synthesis response regulator PhoP